MIRSSVLALVLLGAAGVPAFDGVGSRLAPAPKRGCTIAHRLSVVWGSSASAAIPGNEPFAETVKKTSALLLSEHGKCGSANRQSRHEEGGHGATALTNVLSGVTVALAMVPEAISFAFVAGVSPLVGLWTTVAMGGTASLFGGRGGAMTGASGAVATVIAELVTPVEAD